MQGTEENFHTHNRTGDVWRERERWVPRGVATYSHIVADRAHGAELWDIEGRRFLDFAGGIGTVNVGHTPSSVVEAIRDQAGRLIHSCFSVAIYEPYVELARRLASLVPGPSSKKCMLVNSGSEAVENAVKVARAATGRSHVIAFGNAFHGRTMMSMTLTGKEKPYKAGFGPFAPNIHHTPFPYAYRCHVDTCHHNGGPELVCPVEKGRELERVFEEEVPANDVAAIVVEPVQGEGGFVVATPDFLRRLREICDRHGILLIVDEVQTGFGRTGKMFAIEHAGIEADVVVLAKSLAAGMPLGAIVGKADIMDAPGPGSIGGTYGGNPLACRAALAVLDLFDSDNLLVRSQEIGRDVMRRFETIASRYDIIGDVRGLGAMLAMELVRDRTTKEPATSETSEIMHRCHEAGLLVIKAGLYDNVIRILVPLVVTPAQLKEGLNILEDVTASVNSSLAGTSSPTVLA